MARTGYEVTPPTGGGNVGVIFVIDKTGFIAGAKETGRALTSAERSINSKLRRTGQSVTTEVIENDLAMAAKVTVRSLEGALDEVANDWGKAISASGKNFFKEIIKTAPNRVKPRDGRIDTHLMLNSVRGRTTNRKNETMSAIGWDDVYYRYFSFQEDGTRGGAMPMGAVPKTARYLAVEFDKNFGRMLQNRIEKIK